MTEVFKFKCLRCGEDFETLDEVEWHYRESHVGEVPEYDIVELSNIEDNSEESPDEDSVALTDEEIKERELAEKEVKMYENGELYEVEEKQLISKLAGIETGHRKEFPTMAKTSNVFQIRYADVLNKLRNPESIACPICGLSWRRIAGEIKGENLSQTDIT